MSATSGRYLSEILYKSMKKTEKESLIDQRISLHKIEKYIEDNQLEQIGEFFPGFLHFNHKDDLHIKYMNPKGLEKLDVPLEWIQENGAEFFEKFVDKETIEKTIPKILNFYARNDTGRTFAFCQKFRDPFKKAYHDVITVTKVVRDLEGLITVSMPADEFHSSMRQVSSLIKADPFYIKHYEKFQSLTNREKEILRFIASGHTNKSTGEFLSISEHTVRTHRNRIWKKLDIRYLGDAIRYAEVFELI